MSGSPGFRREGPLGTLDLAMRSPPSLVLSFAGPVLAALLAGCGSSEDPAPHGGALPSADVELVIDDLGVTHVYAEDDADAFYGAGYAMARDRLFQMELNRRHARGTTAEVFGEDHLP